MKDFIIPVNNEAHSRALVAVVGEETAQKVLEAYKALDAAMVFGYERGLAESEQQIKAMAQEYIEALKRAEERAVAAATSEPEAALNAAVEGETCEFKKQVVPQNAVQALEKEAFSNGYDIGKHEGKIEGFRSGYLEAEEAYVAQEAADNSANQQDAYDDGYCAGVQDARTDPEEADDYIDFLTETDGYDMTEGNDDFFDYSFDDFDPSDYMPVEDGAEGSEYTVDGERLY